MSQLVRLEPPRVRRPQSAFSQTTGSNSARRPVLAKRLCRRSIFLVGTTHNDLDRVTWKSALQLLRLPLDHGSSVPCRSPCNLSGLVLPSRASRRNPQYPLYRGKVAKILVVGLDLLSLGPTRHPRLSAD